MRRSRFPAGCSWCALCTTLLALQASAAVVRMEPSDILRLARRQTSGTDTIYSTTTATVWRQPGGQAAYTVTNTATVTMQDGGVSNDPPITTATATTTKVLPPTGGGHTTTVETVMTVTRHASSTIDQGGSAEAQSTHVPLDTVCFEGDVNEREPGVLSTTHQQRQVLYVFPIYVLGILVTWHMVGIRTLLHPMKMLAGAYHEFWHVLCGSCFGFRLEAVDLDPLPGTRTIYPGGPLLGPPIISWFAAMLGNAIIGSLLVFCGFNTLASKIASFFVGLSFVAILWYNNSIQALALTAAWLGLMIGLWFISHAMYLKFYILFLGVMTALFCIWDITDELVFRKANDCCPRQLQNRSVVLVDGIGIPMLRASFTGAGWTILSILILAAFIVAAVAVFRQTPHGEFCQAATFLPT